MFKSVMIAIGNRSDVIKAKEIRFIDDMVCIIEKDGGKVTTHKQNIVIYEEGDEQ